MKILIVFVFFVLFAITFLSSVKNVFADVIVPKYKPKTVIIPPDTIIQFIPDTSIEKDTVNSNQSQDNPNFFKLIQPRHIAIGGVVFIVVILSFVILSKLRNKK